MGESVAGNEAVEPKEAPKEAPKVAPKAAGAAAASTPDPKGDLSARILEEVDGVKERLSALDGGPGSKKVAAKKARTSWGPVVDLFDDQGDDQ